MVDRDGGVNIHRFGDLRKARLSNFQLIDAVGQSLHVEIALIVGRQSVPILGLAGDLNRRLYAQAGWIDNIQPQFAVIRLPENDGR